MAVIMPTGISVGAIMIRANVSHSMRKLAPKNIDAGSKILRSGPTIRRTI